MEIEGHFNAEEARTGRAGGKGIAAKLAALRREIGPVERDGHDRHLNRRYVTTEAMIAAVREAADTVGLATTSRQRLVDHGVRDVREGGKEVVKHYQIVEVTLTFLDPETGDYEQMVGLGMGEDAGARVTNIATTYALRNCLKAGFLIGDDSESEAGEPRAPRSAPLAAQRRVPHGWGLSEGQAQEIRGALAGVAADQVRAFLADFGAATPGDIPVDRFEEAKASATRIPRASGHGRRAS